MEHSVESLLNLYRPEKSFGKGPRRFRRPWYFDARIARLGKTNKCLRTPGRWAGRGRIKCARRGNFSLRNLADETELWSRVEKMACCARFYNVCRHHAAAGSDRSTRVCAKQFSLPVSRMDLWKMTAPLKRHGRISKGVMRFRSRQKKKWIGSGCRGTPGNILYS